MEIALALGGGGSRGNAHIGVLRVLEQAGCKIRAIAGTSFGGVVAAMYAAGYSPDEIEAQFCEVDQNRLYGRAPDDGPAILGTAGVQKFLDKALENRKFEDLKTPCAMAAADLNCGCEIVLKTGSVKEAILATIAIPGIFPPRKIDEFHLVDGGVLNPIPVSLARELAPGLPVIAVALTSMPEVNSQMFAVPMPSLIPGALLDRLSQMRLAQAMSIFLQSLEVGDRMLAELRLKVDKPDIIIRPDVSHIALLENVDVHEVVKLGEDAATQMLPDIQRLFSIPARIGRALRLGARK